MLFEIENEPAAETPPVYANYTLMDDDGAFTQTLRSKVDDLISPSALSSPRGDHGREVVPVVSLTMLRHEISGPTRTKLNDPQTVRFLEAFFAEHQEQLMEAVWFR